MLVSTKSCSCHFLICFSIDVYHFVSNLNPSCSHLFFTLRSPAISDLTVAEFILNFSISYTIINPSSTQLSISIFRSILATIGIKIFPSSSVSVLNLVSTTSS